MLTLAKIGRGQEDYHLRSVGEDASQYYAERGEVAGVWVGRGATALGLHGQVEGASLVVALSGQDSAGRQLVRPPARGERMPGWDACFTAPKSVSVLWGLGHDIEVGGRTLGQVIEAAHDEAVREAMSYFEREAAKGRRGHDGLAQVESSGFVAAGFRHRTSRANDPHLHTHVVIANMCQGSDGRWGALDGRLVYAHRQTAGYLYDAHLRHRLSVDLGVRWERWEHDIFEVAGVPEALTSRFSKRAREIRGSTEAVTARINDERAALGLAPVEAGSQRALDIAARETRAAKLQHVATADLRARWRAEVEAAGIDVGELVAALNRADAESQPATLDDEQRDRIARR